MSRAAPGHRLPVLVARGTRLAVALVSAATLAVVLAGGVLAASPTPGVGGDPRSSGEGPGLIGDPAFAIVAVLAIGAASVVLTLAFIRLTGGRTR